MECFEREVYLLEILFRAFFKPTLLPRKGKISWETPQIGSFVGHITVAGGVRRYYVNLFV